MDFESGASPVERAGGAHGSIWLVEDSPLEAELACGALRGFSIEVFADGPSMLERMSTHGRPDVLLLDGQLPGMSGLEICRFVRASIDEVGLPILMLTVQGHKADVVEALSAGANDYLTKPYDTAELVARVVGLARARHLQQDLEAERLRLRAADSERERLLAHANEGWKSAQEANHVKDDFLAVVSHELRTPLNAIVGWVSLLQSGRLPPERIKHAFDTIERNARAQTQLIDDLLDVSRIISGKLHIQMQHVNFEDLARLAFDAIEPAARSKKLALSIEVESADYTVLGDPVRLQQVVWNLLSNALKFTPDGGFIRMKLTCSDGIRLTVTDSGRGIDMGLLPYIFDRFRQAEGTTARRHGGLGLGLAIVKELMQLHGGSVHAESAGEGQGATFWLDLPALDGSAADVTRDSKRPRAIWQRELENVRVLLVDDHDDAREVVGQLLESAGATVTTASSAKTCIEALELEVPDVLVSDIGMPIEDGFALIKKVRARPLVQGGKIPAVALTAYARSEDRATALRAGFNAHVAKPIDATELVAVLASLCGHFS